MNKLLTTLLVILLASTSYAQREALIDHADSWNLFSRFEATITELDEDTALLGGLSIGGYLNEKIGIGISGHMLLDDVATQSLLLGKLDIGDLWYAGGYAEYVMGSENLIYGSISLFAGGGRLEVPRAAGSGSFDANILVLEPSANLMINITETASLGIGGGYRFFDGANAPGLSDNDLSGAFGRIFLRFTEF